MEFEDEEHVEIEPLALEHVNYAHYAQEEESKQLALMAEYTYDKGEEQCRNRDFELDQ